jgi:hypothetical protein
MYTIQCDNQALYNPRTGDLPINNPYLDLEANKIGSLSFTIFPGHPMFDGINKISSLLEIYKDGDIYWRSRPSYTKLNFNGSVSYKCEEEVSRLNDFRFRQLTYTGTVDDFITAVLASYNARVPSAKQLIKGNVSTVSGNITYATTKPLGHYDALQSSIVNNVGGYIVARYTNNANYIDYYTEADLPNASQEIKYGENLVDLFIETDSDSTYSVLYPIGIKANGDTVYITSVNNNKDYLESSAGIALYGRRETSITWENITDATQLKTLAQEELNKIAVKFADSIQLSGYDLHNADSNVQTFGFLNKVKCVSAKHGLSARYVAKKMRIPLGDPDSTTIGLGKNRETLTDKITLESKKTKETSAKIQNQIYNESSRAQTAEGTLSTNITTVDGRITAEITRATNAENGKISKTTQYQTADQIVSEAVTQSGTNAGNTYIAKTTRLQTADSIVNEAVSQAATNGNNSYIAKTTYYQTADQIVLSAESAGSAAGATAGSSAGATAGATSGASAAETYVDSNAYKKVSGIAIKSEGIEVSGSTYVNIKSGGSFVVESGNFNIDTNGNVEIKGKVTAESGKIGGFNIKKRTLGDTSQGFYLHMAEHQEDRGIYLTSSNGNHFAFQALGDGTVVVEKLYLWNGTTYVDVTAKILAL